MAEPQAITIAGQRKPVTVRTVRSRAFRGRTSIPRFKVNRDGTISATIIQELETLTRTIVLTRVRAVIVNDEAPSVTNARNNKRVIPLTEVQPAE